jgi:hypothetical protein
MNFNYATFNKTKRPTIQMSLNILEIWFNKFLFNNLILVTDDFTKHDMQ